jgi:hypothetical protein
METVIILVVYGCGALFLTLCENSIGLHRNVFESKELRRIIRLKKEEVTRGCIELHNEDFIKSYTLRRRSQWPRGLRHELS